MIVGSGSTAGVTSGVGRGVREDNDDDAGDGSRLTLGFRSVTEVVTKEGSWISRLTVPHKDELCEGCEVFDLMRKNDGYCTQLHTVSILSSVIVFLYSST